MVSFRDCLGICISKFRGKQPKTLEPDSVIGGLLGSYPANPVQHPELNPELADMKNSLELIIAFVNPKSGGQKGRVVFERLKNYLHKDNVFDLTKGGPKPGLEKHKDKKNLRVIACGGDGTVGWVLSVIDEIDFGENLPAVSILPLGTGNDLARTLGWGGGYNNESMEVFLNKVINGKLVQLDRWTITTSIIERKNENVDKNPSESKEDTEKAKAKLPLTVLNNYFSIGADAKIALDFHEAREKNPEQFTSQAFNKIEYARNYSKDLINQSCKNTIQNIKEFECDGVDCLAKIKELNSHSIVFLNIPSYMSGKKPWKNGEDGFETQSYSDGKLETVGFQTADLMFLQMGVHGDHISQSSRIRIVTEKTLPMQVDGEPVLLLPSEIIIEKKNQACMIQASDEPSLSITDIAAGVCCCCCCFG